LFGHAQLGRAELQPNKNAVYLSLNCRPYVLVKTKLEFADYNFKDEFVVECIAHPIYSCTWSVPEFTKLPVGRIRICGDPALSTCIFPILVNKPSILIADKLVFLTRTCA
jgi:hypothetical protein